MATLQIQHWDNVAVLASETGKAKMGQCLGGDLSLVARAFWHAFGLILKGFFTHFVVVSSRFIVKFSHFIAVFYHLFVLFSYGR